MLRGKGAVYMDMFLIKVYKAHELKKCIWINHLLHKKIKMISFGFMVTC